MIIGRNIHFTEYFTNAVYKIKKGLHRLAILQNLIYMLIARILQYFPTKNVYILNFIL
jgi:hypothetical protein